MDRLTRTTNIIKAYYLYKHNQDAATFVKEVCEFFDFMKDKLISESDLNFLLFLSNEAGIPQYYDLLEKKFTNSHISSENLTILALNAFFFDASLIRGDAKFHKYQIEVINKFKTGESNRFVLTAPTSFGKTFLVYEILQEMQYQNSLLIFPAISLLAENYARLCKMATFQSYKIHSLSEEDCDLSEKNIYIFTPERFLSFMDLHKDLHFDFAFIDEVYKIDNSFILDQEKNDENERDIAYRLALEYISRMTEDMLLAGPYMTLPEDNTKQKSFNNFAKDNHFEFLRYNQFEIVSKEFITVKSRHQYNIDGITIEIGSVGKVQKIANIIKSLSTPKENTIIYCSRRSDTESYTKALLKDESLISFFQRLCSQIESSTYEMFVKHLEHTFGGDWVVVKALKGRIGIHHSLIPKYIQKEIINLFNNGALICLFSTTTITEGVNTSAKNIIITSNKKGAKPLRQFDAKNIAGRAGRFNQHYSGRVIDLNNDFENIINEQPEVLEHKNYDLLSPKTDVDYQITADKYLTEKDRQEKNNIQDQIIASKIPIDIFYSFRIVGPKDKLDLFGSISKMPKDKVNAIKNVSMKLVNSKAKQLDWAGFQIIMDTILPIVKEEKLKQLIMKRVGEKQYSLITVLLNSYLSGGFLSMVDYYVGRRDNAKTKDEAIRQVADFVYNVFKYHLVKYLGLFDVFFRYVISRYEKTDMNDVIGLGLLLQKLEYNALNPNARKASDYGVPFKLIDYYDNVMQDDKSHFDAYEQYIDREVSELLK